MTQDMEIEEEDTILSGASEYLDRIDVDFSEGESLPLEDILLPIEILIQETSLRGRMTDVLYLDEIDCFVISKKVIELFGKKNVLGFQTLELVMIDPYSNAEAVEEAKLKDEHLEYREVIYSNYEIFNVNSLLDCVDHTVSNLEYFVMPPDIPEDIPEEMKAILQEQEQDNDIDFIRKLVLDESKIPDDIKIFRLKDCPRILVFKEEIVQAIREEGLTGFVFVPLSEYTDEIPDDDDDEEGEEENVDQKEQPQNIAPPQSQPEKTGTEKGTDSGATGKSIVIKRIKKNT